MMVNHELADIFSRFADALEFKGENPFKITAYRKVSRIIKDLSYDLEEFGKEHPFTDIPGIGAGIAKKISEYIETGTMKKYDDTVRTIPPGIFQMLEIPYLGPKTLKLLHSERGIASLKDLKQAMKDGDLSQLPGMGEKKIERLQQSIGLFESAQLGKKRFLIGDVYPAIESIIEGLQKHASRVVPCGSYRRMKETVGDIDLLATSIDPKKVIDHFIALSCVNKVINVGKTKATVILEKPKIQTDLRVVDPSSFGACLQYFTGSKAHNVRLRSIAKTKGLKISEYGVFKGKKKQAGKTESSVYRAIGLPLIPPEMREDNGEIELAMQDTLPAVVDYGDFKGDLHIHSNHSDGTQSIEEIARTTKRMGYRYIAICDHSKSVHYAGGLSEEHLLKKNEEIDALNKKLKGIKILKGAEVDILSSGKLDYPDRILETLDIVIAAIHQGFTKNVTERFVDAMDNPHVHVIAHPTGRLIFKRKGYNVNLDRVFEKAKETNTIMEINAYFERIDLNDVNVRKARSRGLKFAIGTDAHNSEMLEYWRLGIGVARRAWLTREDVINCYSCKKLMKLMERKK
jgi:DNA polymerase (family 10)